MILDKEVNTKKDTFGISDILIKIIGKQILTRLKNSIEIFEIQFHCENI